MPKVILFLILLSPPFWSAHSATQMPEPAADPVASCRSGTHDFRISRKGNVKGLMRANISRDGSLCRIVHEEWLEDTHYCHQIYREETWRGRELVDYFSLSKGWCGLLAKLHDASACRWNRDGSPIEVTARRVGDQMEIRGGAVSATYPADVATMTFLGPRYPFGSGTLPMIDPFRGEVTETQVVEVQDDDRGTTVFEVAGDRLTTLVYDRDHMLSQLIVDGGIGGDVTFDLVSSGVEQPVAKEPECKAVFDPLHAQ